MSFSVILRSVTALGPRLLRAFVRACGRGMGRAYRARVPSPASIHGRLNPFDALLFVEGRDRDARTACFAVDDRYPPRLAADLAVFDVVLRFATPGIERDVDAGATIRADDQRVGVRR